MTDGRAVEGLYMNKEQWLRSVGRRLQDEHGAAIKQLADDAEANIARREHALSDAQPARDGERRAAADAVESTKVAYDAAVAHRRQIEQAHTDAAHAVARETREIRSEMRRAQELRTEQLRRDLDAQYISYKRSIESRTADERDEHGALADVE